MITQDKSYVSQNLMLKYNYEFKVGVPLEELVKVEKAWSNGRNIESLIELLVSQFEHELRVKMGFELQTDQKWVYCDNDSSSEEGR